MKKRICLLVISLLMAVSAGAWAQDAALSTEKEKALPQWGKYDAHRRLGIPFLQNKSEDLAMEIKALSDALDVMRQRQADQGADITEIRDIMKIGAGKMEELLKSISAAEKKLQRLNAKVSRMERSLATRQEEAKGASAGIAVTPAKEALPDPKAVYDTALRYFQEEKYDEAREHFQRIVHGNADAALAAQAQFWIGECLYFDGEYEQAILEYEKAVKLDPKGEKTPHALLKEGLSFSKLGDQATAKLVFQQLIDLHPESSPATMAAARLAEMK